MSFLAWLTSFIYIWSSQSYLLLARLLFSRCTFLQAMHEGGQLTEAWLRQPRNAAVCTADCCEGVCVSDCLEQQTHPQQRWWCATGHGPNSCWSNCSWSIRVTDPVRALNGGCRSPGSARGLLLRPGKREMAFCTSRDASLLRKCFTK